jgi:hypothetical protein
VTAKRRHADREMKSVEIAKEMNSSIGIPRRADWAARNVCSQQCQFLEVQDVG